MKRALLIEHDPYTRPGFVGEALQVSGYSLERRTVVPAESFADPNIRYCFDGALDYDLIVPMGAPWSVYDEAAIGQWLVPELELLRQAHAADQPVLGICFGGQALSAALGGQVMPAPRWEIGFTTVESELAWLGPGPWFQFHHDAMLPPPGAQTLARNEVGVQAWQWGHTFAVQFHPEVDAPTLGMWLEHGGEAVLRSNGLDPQALQADLEKQSSAARERTAELMSNILARIA